MTDNEKDSKTIPIHRYIPDDIREFTMAFAGPDLEIVSAHIEKHLGQIDSVYHEIISDLVHIDINYIKPSEKFPFHIFVTTGMSDIPMNVPEGLEEHRFAEVYVLLPIDWPVPTEKFSIIEEAFKSENHYWPIRWLKVIARFPHEFKTWIGWGHSIPNGEDAAPFAENTKFGCMLLMPAISLPFEFFELKVNPEKTVKFFCLYPLYKEEMEYRIKKGTDDLLIKFDRNNIRDVIDINRINTCIKKPFWKL
jgi:hypothetical protein